MVQLLNALLAASGLVGFCQAVLRVPLRHELVKGVFSQDKQKRDVKGFDLGDQHPLKPLGKKLAVQPLKVNGSTLSWRMYKAEVDIQDVALILVGFNISIGTPAQSFKVSLSIESDYLMLQSDACKSDRCQDMNHTGFDSSKSSTFSDSPDRFTEVFGLVRWEGYHAKETIGVGDVSFPTIPFLLADYISDIGWFHWYYDYDGALGLSPNSPAWRAMKESGLLEEEVFGLKFPSGPFDFDQIGNRTDGELSLGGISPDFASAPFVDLPLAGGDYPPVWSTGLQSVALSNGTEKQPYPISPAAVASFVSASPFITLPYALAHSLVMQVLQNSTGIVASLPAFPCEMRDSLMNVELTLGAGDLIWNVTLSPYDYCVRMVRSAFGNETCVMVAVPMEGAPDGGIIALGWPFLRRFYSVFDHGRKLIRCKFSQP